MKILPESQLLCQEECHSQDGAKRCWHGIKRGWRVVENSLNAPSPGRTRNSWRKLLGEHGLVSGLDDLDGNEELIGVNTV